MAIRLYQFPPLGARPSSIDASVYAVLANYWEASIDTPLKALVERQANLTAYCTRMRALCYPD